MVSYTSGGQDREGYSFVQDKQWDTISAFSPPDFIFKVFTCRQNHIKRQTIFSYLAHLLQKFNVAVLATIYLGFTSINGFSHVIKPQLYGRGH